jgi:ketosteroid isomerase-like protein
MNGRTSTVPAPAPRARRLATQLLAGAVMLVSACASSPAPYDGSAQQRDDQAQMRAAIQASADAWNRGDLAGHLALYDATVTTMTRNGPRPGVAAIESAFRSTYFNGDKPKQNLRTERVAIRALSRDSALMTGRFVLSGGVEAEQSGWFSLVWVRTSSGWKVVHDHSS